MPSLTKAEADAQQIRQLQENLKRCREDLQEYIMAEKVMIAAGKVGEATVEQAHELVRNIK
jgi:adenylosuccinate lyase